jgi:hypothetical protein
MAESQRAFSLNLVRLGAYLALFAGAAWMVLGFVAVITLIRGGGVHSPAFLGSALYVVAFVGTLGGIVGLHVRQSSGYGLLGKAGFAAAFSGTALLVVGLVLLFALGDSPEPTFLDTVLALWDALAGFVLVGVATLRLTTLPQPCGWALLASPPLALLLGDYGGGMVLGVAWLVVGYALLAQRDVSALLPTKSG